MQTSERKIPFVRPVRVGNYKLWKTSLVMGKGKDKTSVEQICVANLDGTWSVRIPEMSAMFATISNAYGMEDGEKFLEVVFANMQSVCLITNEFLHDGFSILRDMLTMPYLLLPEKEMRKRMKGYLPLLGVDKKAGEKHIDKMCAYRKELYDLINVKIAEVIGDYELKMEQRKAAEGEAQQSLENEAVAQQIINEVEKTGDEQAE